MFSTILAIQPLFVSLDEVTISAQIDLNHAGQSWEVIVFLSQPPRDSEAIELLQGSDIDAQIITDSGVSLRILERPSGALVLTEGGLGSSTSAPFQFQKTGDIPERLVVTYQNQTASFNLIEGDRESNEQ